MGSYAILKIGRLTLDEQKFREYVDQSGYSALFQKSDVVVRNFTPERYEEGEAEEVFEWPLAVKGLSAIADRLDLLGYSNAWVSQRVAALIEECTNEATSEHTLDPVPSLISDDVIYSISELNVNDERATSHRGLEYYLPYVLADHLNSCFGLSEESTFFKPLCEQLSSLAALRILAKNPKNKSEQVEWDYGEGVLSEYVGADELPAQLTGEKKFLLVTEGRTDARILERAFRLRRAHVADFFYFVDMAEGYPFGGVGNLHNFCKGLAAIGVQNRTIIIYDNDAEGVAKYYDTKRLPLPPNISVMHLPTLQKGQMVSSIGPSGTSIADVNERAASIEYYLDLGWVPREPKIRWSNYVERIDRYQGALVDKNDYIEVFVGWTPSTGQYDFEKLDLCLDAICQAAGAMASILMPASDESYADCY